jgi:hypothetical protein
MKVCNNYSLIHKFLINHILSQTVLLTGVCGACHQKELYRDIFLTLNIVHSYSLCSILKNMSIMCCIGNVTHISNALIGIE